MTLWHSELAALASDREVRELWQGLLALWAASAGAMLRANGLADRARPGSHAAGDPAARSAPGLAGAAAAAGTAAAVAASADGVDEIVQLSRRVAELERRLAATGSLTRKPRKR